MSTPPLGARNLPLLAWAPQDPAQAVPAQAPVPQLPSTEAKTARPGAKSPAQGKRKAATTAERKQAPLEPEFHAIPRRNTRGHGDDAVEDKTVTQAKATARDSIQALAQGKDFESALAAHDQLAKAMRARNLKPEARRQLAEAEAQLKEQLILRAAKDLGNASSPEALKRAAEIADRLSLTQAERSNLIDRTAEAMEARGKPDEANHLRAAALGRRLDDDAKAGRYNPVQRSIRAIDRASEALDKGQGLAAAELLETEAKRARDTLKTLDPNNTQAKGLLSFAENAEARAKTYKETVPDKAFDAAKGLSVAAQATDARAEELEKAGKKNEAKLLRAIAADSRYQSAFAQEGARTTNALIGQGISQTYRKIVEASFDNKIKETGTLFGLRTGPRDQLIADKKKMEAVFDEIDRTMKESGVSFDRAWNMMFQDGAAAVPGPWKEPRKVPGFGSRRDAAEFLREHEVTKNLAGPFGDMARGFSSGNGEVIDKGRADMVRVLREHGQWGIARQMLDAYKKNPSSEAGRRDLGELDANERGEWWKQKANDFVLQEMPTLILSGVVSGGLGWGAGAAAKALSWGPRLVKAAQVGTELATFVPTERILNEAINGKAADWSASGLARDYAFSLGGYALFQGLGRGWSYLRAGKNLAPKIGETLEGVVPNLGTGAARAGGALGREAPLAESLIQKLPGWTARDNATFGRAMAEVTEQLQGKMANGEIKTFQQALDWMGGQVNRVARATSRGDLGYGQSMDSFGKLRTPNGAAGGNIETPINGAYAGYDGKAAEFVGPNGVRTMTQDGIPLTTTMRFPQGNKLWFHTSPKSFPQITEKMEQAWQRAVSAKSQDELINAVAEFHWWGAHMAPFERGSAGAIDAMTKALLRKGGINPGAWREGVAVDLEAFTMSKDDFVRAYRSFFQN